MINAAKSVDADRCQLLLASLLAALFLAWPEDGLTGLDPLNAMHTIKQGCINSKGMSLNSTGMVF